MPRGIAVLSLTALIVGFLYTGCSNSEVLSNRQAITSSSPVTEIRVRDGDTIVVDGQAWRLNGVDCPERKTPDGNLASQHMRKLTSAASTIQCEWNGDVSYDRKVGQCFADGRDLGALMVEDGFCGACPRYSTRYVELDVYTGSRAGYCG